MNTRSLVGGTSPGRRGSCASGFSGDPFQSTAQQYGCRTGKQDKHGE